MNRTMIAILAAGLAVALGLAAPAPALAGSHDKHVSITVDADGDQQIKRKVRIRTVDADGKTHDETLEVDGSSGFLGVTLSNTEDDAGAKVLGVMEDSGAENAGLEKGDVIVGVNGQTVSSPFELTRAMAGTEPGDTVDIEFLRDGNRRTVTAELGERKGWVGIGGLEHLEHLEHLGELKHLEHLKQLDLGDLDIDLDDLNMDLENLDIDLSELHEALEGLEGHRGIFIGRSSRPKLGVQLVDATADLREHMGAPRDAGVLVGKVMDDMPAEDAGVEVGDLIVGIDGNTVAGAGDLIRGLRDKSGETVELEVIRDGRRMSIDAYIPEPEED